MKKAKILDLIPKAKELKASLKEKQKALGTLGNEVLDLEATLEELKGVTIHEDFPIQVVKPNDNDTEVWSACDEVSRYALVTPSTTTAGTYRVAAFKSEEDSDSTPLIDGAPEKKALKVAKDFVAIGTRKKKAVPA